MAINEKIKISLEPWVHAILAHPITKCPAVISDFMPIDSVVDARVLLKNTFGFNEWQTGQIAYEKLDQNSQKQLTMIENYKVEIAYDRPIYEYFHLDGVVLDVGGGACTLREFLPSDIKIISIDPYISCIHEIQPVKIEAYPCLARPLNFIGAVAEFLPFTQSQFDWVHMRSMLDHVQIADLALLEAHRVLKDDGKLLVGLYVEGGKSGKLSPKQKLKHFIKEGLSLIGIDRWKDHHTWHPTFANLTKLIEDNGFTIVDVYWQPQWQDQVCYIQAQKS